MLNNLLQQATSPNGRARQYAIEHTVELTNLIPPTVSYESGGHTLIIGPTMLIERITEPLSSMASITLLSVDGEPGTQSNLYYADTVEISGFLGAFSVNVENHGKRVNLAQAAIGGNSFDIVLDMSLNGLMSEEVPVPGYFPVGRGYPKLADALEEIPTLMGTFDKPKYFRLIPICARTVHAV